MRGLLRGSARSGIRAGAALVPAIALLIELGLAIGIALPATGDGGEVTGCEEQAQRLCGSLSDDGARERCALQRELECEDSGPSNVTRKRVRDPATQMRSACRADFERVCADLGSNASRGPILACLQQHQDEVSDPCKLALSLEAEATRRPDYDECRTEIRKLCPGAIGREPLRECLRDNGDALSEECRRVLVRRAAGGDMQPPPGAGRGNP